jgi:hypothetical protein
MHNSLKYFRDNNRNSVFSQMESFMKTENVTGKSISIEHDGDTVVALLGYIQGNPDGQHFHTVVKSVCRANENEEVIQEAINKTADEMGSFICQSTFIEHGDLSVVFLTC